MPSTPTLHAFCGKAGAGKSTLAARLAQEHGALLISEDVWAQRLYGDDIQTFADFVRCARRLSHAMGPHVVALLKAGNTVVLDFQCNTRSRRAWLRSLIDEAGTPHVLHWLRTPDALCLQRIAKRNVERPEGSSQLSEADFHHVSSFFEPPAADEGFNLMPHDPP